MSDQWAPAPAPRRPRRWPRRLPWIAGVLLVLLGVLYLFVTSQTFLETFVLPKVSAALGTSVSVGDAGISPFRKVTLRDLKVGGGSFEEPLLTVREVRARYSLWDIIGGNINIHEVALVSPVIQIVQLEDGTSNLDPLLNRPAEPASESPPSAQPVQLQLGRFVLTNALVRQIKHLPGGGREVAELSDVNITIANLRNAQVGSMNLGASLRFERTPGQNTTNITPELVVASLAGQFEIGLTAELQPESIRGSTTLDLVTPPAAARDIKGTVAVLDCDLTPTDLRQLTLTFKQAGNTLGQITAKGPLDLQTKEGRITLEITSIGRNALNLAGAAAGLDFGSTTINATQQITITNAGQHIIAVGRLAADKLSIVQKGAATRPLDFAIDYNVTLDKDQNSALIQQLTLSGIQDSAQIIRGNLRNSMRVDLSGGTNSVDPSVFSLQVTNFNLADWRAFIGEVSGTASLGLDVTTAGKHLAVHLDSRMANLSATFGSNKVQRSDLDLSLRAGLDEMKSFRVDELLLRLGRNSQPAFTFTASGKGDIKDQQADLTLKLDTDLPRLTNLTSIAGLPAATLKLNTQVLQRGQKFHVTNFIAQLQQAGRPATTLNVNGSYDLASTNGVVVLRLQAPDVLALAATNPAPGKALALDLTLDARLNDNVATIRDFTGKLVQNGTPGGSVAAAGEFNMKDQRGKLTLTLAGVNEAALAPLLDPALGAGRTLTSCSLNLKADAQYDQKGGSSLNTELQLARLVINDPAKQFPATPLSTTLKLAGSMRDDAVALESFALDLATGETVGGQIRTSGKYDLKAKTAEGSLRIVDLTEKFLAPFAAIALTNKNLTSVSINVDLAGRYDPARDITLKGDLNVSNLLLSDPDGKLPQTPLSVGLELNAAMAANNVLNVDTCRLKLAPTARARNELILSGKLDFARTNIYSGDLRLSADSLDFTPYYDMFAAASATNAAPVVTAQQTKTTTTAPATNALPREPDAVKLPFDKFNFALNIGQLYLRDVAIQNWQTTVAIDGSRVQVTPLQLSLNGSPVKGALALNLGIPGYQYNLSLNATRVPVAPFVDTFVPEQKGKIKGDLILASQIKGAGVTGRSLQKSLAGDFSFSFTNANFKMTGGSFFALIGRYIGVPDLADSPISWVAANSRVGQGIINVSQFNVVSETFTADTQGEIRIADLVANSPLEKWPMHLWLRRSIAQRLGKIPRNTPPDAQYVKMPDFVRVAGTLSAPKPELNKAALAGAVAEKFIDKALQNKTGGLNPLNPLAK